MHCTFSSTRLVKYTDSCIHLKHIVLVVIGVLLEKGAAE